MLWLRTILFTLLIPGTVLILLPFALVSAGIGPRFDPGIMRWLGVVPLALGLMVIFCCPAGCRACTSGRHERLLDLQSISRWNCECGKEGVANVQDSFPQFIFRLVVGLVPLLDASRIGTNTRCE
jgi:hypothetical protein